MTETLTAHQPYSILATEPRADDQTRVLKHCESFAVFDRSGARRARRGGLMAREVAGAEVALAYDALAGARRRTRLRFAGPPAELTDTHALFRADLPGHAERTFDLTIACEIGGPAPRLLPFGEALAAAERWHSGQASCCAVVATSNERFNEWADRSAADLRMMITDTPQGPYPYAGIPWYSTVFGRDGILTALEMLWVDPAPARGVL